MPSAKRYRELVLRPYAPIAIALITTEEVPSTVRRLAEGAGIFVFSASDLFHILSPKKSRVTKAALRKLIKKHAKSISTLVWITGRSDVKKEKATNISVDSLYLMPATTYSPTHFRAQYNRPSGA
jgi:hypothetical protein